MERLMRAQKRMNRLVVSTIAMNKLIADAINDKDSMTLTSLQSFSKKLSTIAEMSAKDFEEAFRDIEKYFNETATRLMQEGRYE